MCKFCKTSEKRDYFGKTWAKAYNGEKEYFQLNHEPEENAILMFFTDVDEQERSHRWYYMDIKYCPMCGKKLKTK